MVRKLKADFSQATEGQSFTEGRQGVIYEPSSGWPCGLLIIGSGVLLIQVCKLFYILLKN